MNIRMPIFAFILLGILLCAFAGLAFFFFLYDHRDKYYRFEDDAVMTGKDFFCEFRRFGGEENIEISFKLIYEGGETAELLYCKTVSDGSRSKKKLYTVPKETVDKLKAIYREHCVPVLADAPEKEDIAADGKLYDQQRSGTARKKSVAFHRSGGFTLRLSAALSQRCG